jgi:pimeloyl-ACP methyl ester carboxylesterase
MATDTLARNDRRPDVTKDMANTDDHRDLWELRESGPADAGHTVLLLPGALCTAAFFDDLMAEPSLSAESIRLVAATVPGFGGTPAPDDLSMENYARLAGKLVTDLDCDVVVGHSVGANVAIEMAAAGESSGPLLLLSPTFSRKDESIFPRVLDRLSSVLGHLPYAAMLKIIGPAMKGSLPPDRYEALLAELKKNDPRFVRRHTHDLLEYLDRHGSLVQRLCDSGIRTCIVFGEHDDTGLADGERRELEACPRTTLITIPGAGHFTMNQQPGRVAELLLEMVPADAPG